ncbi:MAG: hypothetical protein MZV70_30735 [Desulfobacterales bacterium]|nr:hypothetical protein [Desulfobacterales bacterium]
MTPISLSMGLVQAFGQPDRAMRIFTGISFPNNFVIKFSGKTDGVDICKFAAFNAGTCNNIYDLILLRANRGLVLCKSFFDFFKQNRIDMRDLQGLAGGAVNRTRSIFFRDVAQSPQLFDRKNTCGALDANGTEVCVPFGDDAPFHMNAKIRAH